MACYDQIIMLGDEREAREDVRRMRESDPHNQGEIERLQDIADKISAKLHDHLAVCRDCKKPS